MSEFTIGDIREGRHEGGTGAGALERLFQIFVGGSNPWRESDKDGWITCDGLQIPDFGLATAVEVRLRNGSVEICSLEDEHEDAVFYNHRTPCGNDRFAWRPADSNAEAAPELTREPQWTEPITREVGNHPGSVNGRVQYRIKGNVEWIDASEDYIARYLPSTWDRDAKNYAPLELRFLQSEWDKVHSPLTRENAKFALVTSDLEVAQRHCVQDPETIVGRVVAISIARDKDGGLIRLASNQWLNDRQWTPHPGPASAPKAEEAKEYRVHLRSTGMHTLRADAEARDVDLLEGFRLYVHRACDGLDGYHQWYTVTEYTSGANFGDGDTAEEAIESARAVLARHGAEGLRDAIAKLVKPEKAQGDPQPCVVHTMNMLSAEAAAIRAARAVGAGLTYAPSPDTPMLQRDERPETERERMNRIHAETMRRVAEEIEHCNSRQGAEEARASLIRQSLNVEKPAGLLVVADLGRVWK